MKNSTPQKTVIQTNREKNGWSQAVLASFIGATYSAVSRWERLDRKSRPNPQAIKQIAFLFRIEEGAIAGDYPPRPERHVRRYSEKNSRAKAAQ